MFGKSLAILGVAALAGVASATILLGPQTDSSESETASVEYHISSAYGGYSTIEGLAADADAVVVARIAEEKQHWPNEHLVLTDSQMVVSRVMTGDVSEGDRITVRQTGGVLPNGAVHEVHGDPLMELDADYLLFLRWDSEDGVYYSWSGPEGRFVAEGGRMIALGEFHADPAINDTGISRLALDQVASQVIAATAGRTTP